MVQRRILKDDWRGVDEALNETDSNGNGLGVTVTHYVQLTRLSGSAVQRRREVALSEPLLVIYGTENKGSNSFDGLGVLKPGALVAMDGGEGPLNNLKLNLLPLNEDRLMIRLQNFGDKFD